MEYEISIFKFSFVCFHTIRFTLILKDHKANVSLSRTHFKKSNIMLPAGVDLKIIDEVGKHVWLLNLFKKSGSKMFFIFKFFLHECLHYHNVGHSCGNTQFLMYVSMCVRQILTSITLVCLQHNRLSFVFIHIKQATINTLPCNHDNRNEHRMNKLAEAMNKETREYKFSIPLHFHGCMQVFRCRCRICISSYST